MERELWELKGLKKAGNKIRKKNENGGRKAREKE